MKHTVQKCATHIYIWLTFMDRSLQLSSSDSSRQLEVWSHLDGAFHPRVVRQSKRYNFFFLTKISCTISVHDDSSEGEDGDDFAAAADDDGDLMMIVMFTSAPCRCIGRRCRWTLLQSRWSALSVSPARRQNVKEFKGLWKEKSK